MHIVIENIVKNCFRDLIIEFYFVLFPTIFSETRNERRKRLFIPLFHFIQFSFQLPSIESYRKLKLTCQKNWTEKISRSVIILIYVCV